MDKGHIPQATGDTIMVKVVIIQDMGDITRGTVVTLLCMAVFTMDMGGITVKINRKGNFYNREFSFLLTLLSLEKA